jgi:hypothetical protein
MTSTICPYPGLRPFNEEESIFFKGREQQVERLVKRLEEKKFLMVNGASGDGKSSLIYAGVIPYAKAGFFKAKYNNWIVADFRPERSPLRNLTASICKQLKIEDAEKTEKELGYGFSALCDLYKSSSFHIDESKAEWLNADDKEKKLLKRKGANLLVLVDQFEEFFTNPENYQNGIPSIESQKTVNLLLETYKLAAAQDLPIYVVCTMRSDYIGQCAAFRGLPEAIGYSQFFVPRLKRQEIEQVIEGPAELAGCKISKRLTQTMLNSLTDGFDQLPIFQHALNQIFKAATDGAEEMDLIHLAKVGGLSAKMLSVEDKNTFQKWFENIPAYKKKLLETPSLSNVLNAHANELIYKDNASLLTLKNVDENRNVKVIKVLFQSLTTFDKGRIVRRRATVGEVMDLVNDATLSLNEFNKIILSFREEGNSFIKPYLNESQEILDKNVVLDITHESLIRNWKLVEEWVLEEVENVQTWLEIEKPMQVWKKNITNKNAFWFLTWRFSKLQKYVLSSGLFVLYSNWNKKFPVHLAWLKRISANYTSNDVNDYHLFLKQSKWVNLWNKFQPYLFAAVMLYFIFQINAAKIKEGEIALKNEKIQKELVVKAEQNAKEALQAKSEAELAKQEAVKLKNIAVQNELKTKKELEYLIEHASPIVMASKMNVMYVGVENPFDFAVSGFNTKDIEPAIEVFPETARHLKCNLKKRSNGSYTLKIPKGVIGVKINALAKIGNEHKMLKGDAPYFRVKSLPEPIAHLSNFESNELAFTTEDIPSLTGLSAKFKNFDFDVKAKIISFEISQLMSNEGTKTEKAPLYNHINSGNKFDKKVLINMKHFSTSDSDQVKQLNQMLKDAGIMEFESKYIIENIIAEMPDGIKVTLAPINFKIKHRL